MHGEIPRVAVLKPLTDQGMQAMQGVKGTPAWNDISHTS